MAVLTNGIFGTIRGRLGPLVFSYRNGITVVSRRPMRSKRSKHPAAALQQAKFQLCMHFLNPIRELLNQTNPRKTKIKSGFNKAFSYQITNTIKGELPNLAIDYSLVKLSQGTLPVPHWSECLAISSDELQFKWTAEFELAMARPDDLGYVAIYCPALHQWSYRKDAATRITGTVNIDSGSFSGQNVQTFLGFISADGKWASETVFTGEKSLPSLSE